MNKSKQVNYDTRGQKKLEVWAKAEGLIPNISNINFLGENCWINYFHLINEDFRVNLTSNAE